MKFLSKAFAWMTDPRVALWFCGFFVADALHLLAKGQYWSAALSALCAAVDAWYVLCRRPVVAV